MKNRNRISILCLLLALATLLCACGSAPAQTGDEPAPAASTDAPAPAASTEEPEAPAVEVPDQYKSTADVWSGITLSESPYGYNYDLNYNGRTDITGEYLHGAGSWPICDWGEIELSIWFPMNDQISRTVTDWGDGTNYLFAIMQEKTGIKLDFDTCSSAANATQFPLMIASGNVCDIIQNATIYSGGLSKALQDDVIRDLSDIIEECAPNYLHWLNKREADVREGKLDGGEIVMIYSMGREMQAPIFGPVVRRDWLEDAGLEIPKTIDDWHTMLCTFRDNYSTGEPLDFYTSCYDYGQTFNGAYDVYLNKMCIRDSIWGVLGLVWIKDVYPRLSGLIERIPARWGRPLTAVLAVFMVVDCLFSMSAVTRRADRAEHIPPANAYEAWIDRAFPDDYLTLIFPNMIYVDDE